MFFLIFLVRLYEFEVIHRFNSIVNIFDRIFKTTVGNIYETTTNININKISETISYTAI